LRLRPSLRLFLPAVLLGALLVLGVRGGGPVPPLGPFLDPAHGVWALARSAEFPSQGSASIPGLAAPVRVLYDDRGVPHIFASSEEDAWRAQGYVLARDRLFQMELQTRAASGTLSGLVGPRARDADLATRRRGFPWAAERSFRSLDPNSLIARAARAYAEGVNARIAELARADLPIEYRLLNVRPVRWEPINTSYLFLQMTYTLAWADPTPARQEARARVGAAAAEALFPLNSPIQEPIQPNGQRSPRFDFTALPPPGAPDSLAMGALAETRRTEAIGSNNWAVSPRRTARGAALLAGDPHLDLSLPSIWYELHLHVDGATDVAGVTFAGSPGVIIGFNRDLAWSFTNTGADVRDHYRETVDDPVRPTRYRLDGEWKPLELREEVVRDPRGRVLAVDTVRFTHRGPLVPVRSPRMPDQGQWMSIRWIGWDARSSGEEFLRLDRARTVTEWLDGWKEFAAPAQNGIVADRHGDIAIRSTGKYPVRPDDGRGDRIRDGQSRAADWTGFLPVERYPFARNPAQGFLASANQQPVDPKVNPFYFGADWYSPWRAMRINQLLRADSQVTPDAMRRFQTDPGSVRAMAFLPPLVAAAKRSSDDRVLQAARRLEAWDGRYVRESEAAGLFEAVMGKLTPLVWDELIPPRLPGDSIPPSRPAVVPEDAILLGLMADSLNPWWDNRTTGPVEHRDGILAQAVRAGYDEMVRQWGAPGENWRWERVHRANIWHLLRLPGLSALNLGVQGGPSTLSPSPGAGTHGASWRMVVELGDQVSASGIYPGGQSGNPASARYDDRLVKWLNGSLDSILFPRNPEEIPAGRLGSTLILHPPVP
jgi:penicillin amidase